MQPEKIKELAQKINDTVSSLTNIDAIIRETENDLNNAKIQKQKADEAKWVELLDMNKSRFHNC